MHPILFTTAVSVAGDIVHNISERISAGTAKTAPSASPAVPFATLIEQASAPTPANMARRASDLTGQIGRSAEVAAAVNAAGASGPLQVQIDSRGDATLRMSDGTFKPIHLTEAMRVSARELYHLRQPIGNGAPARPITISVSQGS